MESHIAKQAEPPQELVSAATVQYYDRVAGEWDSLAGEGVTRAYLESRWRSIEQLLAPYTGASHVMELGVGTGVYIQRVAPLFREILAVDFSASMLAVLRRRLEALNIENVKLLKMDVCYMDPISEGSIDLAYAIGLLDNLENPAALFKEVARVLRLGGALVMCTANGRCPWHRLRTLIQGAHHCRTERYLTSEDIDRLARDAGLQLGSVIHWGTVPSTLKSGLLVDLLQRLEKPLSHTFLERYLGGLTFCAVRI